jgi:hypothetical protein
MKISKLERVEKFARSRGYDGAEFLAVVKDKEVYIAKSDETKPDSISGLPVYIIFGSELRFASYSETQDIIAETSD